MRKMDCLSGSHLYKYRVPAEQKIMASTPHNEDTYMLAPAMIVPQVDATRLAVA